VQKLTKENLDNIIKNQLESIAEFKIYFRSVRKDKKLIQTLVRWKLKPKIKYRNKLRKKKGKISQFGISFREKHKSENLQGKVILETCQSTKKRRRTNHNILKNKKCSNTLQ
jgi:hypothetical protein